MTIAIVVIVVLLEKNVFFKHCHKSVLLDRQLI